MKIEFQDIHTTLGRTEILKGVSLTAESGLITGIIGPNGCGKSTLLKTLFGITPHQAGRILLDGEDSSRFTRRQISSRIGYVGQEVAVVFDFSVRDVVEMALYSSGGRGSREQRRERKREIVDNALSQMQILGLAERSIINLSGGERKMVFLARALAQGCDTIILDEPTNHLDIRHQIFIMDYLKKSQMSILIVLHDLNLAAQYCDRLYLLDRGENVVSGDPRSVLDRAWVSRVFQVDGGFMPDGTQQAGFYLDFNR